MPASPLGYSWTASTDQHFPALLKWRLFCPSNNNFRRRIDLVYSFVQSELVKTVACWLLYLYAAYTTLYAKQLRINLYFLEITSQIQSTLSSLCQATVATAAQSFLLIRSFSAQYAEISETLEHLAARFKSQTQSHSELHFECYENLIHLSRYYFCFGSSLVAELNDFE